MPEPNFKMPDGLSFETALFVDSVEEEYEWLDLNYPDFQLMRQSVQLHQERKFDVMEIELIDGNPMTIYFDITDLEVPDLFSEEGL